MARQWGGDGPDRFGIVHYHRKEQRRALYDWQRGRALPKRDYRPPTLLIIWFLLIAWGVVTFLAIRHWGLG